MDAFNPPTVTGLEPTFGYGDRLGMATPGHLLAHQGLDVGLIPILAQQSIREMSRTGRAPAQVVEAARKGIETAGYTGPWSADADHLKTEADVDRTMAAGFTFFTIDPSDLVDPQADAYRPDQLDEKFKAVEAQNPWVGEYLGKRIKLKGRWIVEMDETSVRRAAVKYGRAIHHANHLASYIHLAAAKAGREFEIELSVDETPHPTTPVEHYIIADQCIKAGVKLVSLAPRFVGDFEKGVDFKGDLKAFEKSLKVHAAIARTLGPYKLSLHSGSDKLSVYPLLASITRRQFHIKTAGTSYLEALRAICQRDETLFRAVISLARGHYEKDRATYHVSATLQGVPAPEKIDNPTDLEKIYLDRWADAAPGTGFTRPGRQILHCTYGSVLSDPAIGPEVLGWIAAHSEMYRQVLATHFTRHLEALVPGM